MNTPKFTVYRREFRIRFNGFSYFMGDVLVILHYTNWRWLARVIAFVKHAKWCDGYLTTDLPPARKVSLPLWVRLKMWLAMRRLLNS